MSASLCVHALPASANSSPGKSWNSITQIASEAGARHALGDSRPAVAPAFSDLNKQRVNILTTLG